MSIIYINTNLSTGDDDGTSWENAYQDLSVGLNASTSGDSIYIWKGIHKRLTGAGIYLATNCEVVGGWGDGETFIDNDNYSVICMRPYTGCTIKNCTFINCQSMALFIGAQSDVTIENCKFKGGGIIKASSSDNVIIKECIFSNTRETGEYHRLCVIRFENASYASGYTGKVERCVFIDSNCTPWGQWGCVRADNMLLVTVENCYFAGNSDGLTAGTAATIVDSEASNINFYNNTVYFTRYAQAFLDRGDATVTPDWNIKNNIFHKDFLTEAVINFSNTTRNYYGDITISNNVFYDNNAAIMKRGSLTFNTIAELEANTDTITAQNNLAIDPELTIYEHTLQSDSYIDHDTKTMTFEVVGEDLTEVREFVLINTTEETATYIEIGGFGYVDGMGENCSGFDGDEIIITNYDKYKNSDLNNADNTVLPSLDIDGTTRVNETIGCWDFNYSPPLDFTKEELQYAELFHIYLPLLDKDIYLTTWSSDITFNSNTYIATNIERGDLTKNANLSIDKVKVEIDLSATTITFNSVEYTLLEILKYGWWEKAEMNLYLFDVEAGDGNLYFKGYNKSDCDYDLHTIELTFSSILDLLHSTLPRLRFQNQCNHKFGDALCGIDVSSDTDTDGDNITQSLTVDISTKLMIKQNEAALDPNKFNLGKLTFTTGKLTGLEFTIAYTENQFIYLSDHLPFPATAGDGFDAVMGCDKRGVVCDERYNNYDNFFGFEYIPTPTLGDRK